MLVATVLILVVFAAQPYLMLFLFFAVYASSGIVELILSPFVRTSAAKIPAKENVEEEDIEDKEIILNKEKYRSLLKNSTISDYTDKSQDYTD